MSTCNNKLNSDLNVDYINASGKTIYDIVCDNASRKIFAFFTDNSVSDSPIKNETWGYTYVAIPIQVNQYMVHAYRAYSASVSYQRFLTVDSGWSDPQWFRFDGQAIT